MADLRNYQARVAGTQSRAGVEIDEGLRAYMLRGYNLMALGLAITGVAAFGTAQFAVSDGQLTPFGALIFTSSLRWVIMLAPLGFVFFLSARVHKMSVSAAQTTFWAFAALMGLSLASIFRSLPAIASCGCSSLRASFGALSLWGYTTRRDLSGMGSFLIMGVFGLILAILPFAIVLSDASAK